MNVEQIISGAIIMGYTLAGLFFLKFWKNTGDRLFAIFACAFWVLCVQRIALVVTTSVSENATYLYGLRLAAFVLILIAIIDKNRSRQPRRGS
jgi:hypothetical protein